MTRPAMKADAAISIDHLDRYTGGNFELNQEVLRLFDGQCRDLTAKLESLMKSSDTKAWHDAAHTLKGAARGVGAAAVAEAAAAAEVIGPSNAATLAAVTQLKNASSAALRYIADYLAQKA